MTATYVPVTDVAKLIRRDLRNAFPGIKFSVRSSKYSGGASIDIGWTDGPTGSNVARVVDHYRGMEHDYGSDCWVPRRVLVAGEPGELPTEVTYGSHYIMTNRRESDAFIGRVCLLARPQAAHGFECHYCTDRRPEWVWIIPVRHPRGGVTAGCCPSHAAKVAARYIDAAELPTHTAALAWAAADR